jgi:hypothetical protein
LFSQSIDSFTSQAEDALRQFVKGIPCEGIETKSEGYVSAHFAEKYLLSEPTLDPEPFSKEMDDSGSTATYRHRITNGPSLEFKPSGLLIGSWRRTEEVHGDVLLIRLDVAENPPTKKRHSDIIDQIVKNILTLNRAISQHNMRLQQAIPRLLSERREQCCRLDALRDNL